MKGKKTLPLMLLMIIIFSTLASASAIVPDSIEPDPYVPPTPGTWLYIQNYTFYTENDLTNEEFNVSVGIYNVTGLGSWQFYVDYNNTLLEATMCYTTSISDQYSGALLPSPWNGTKGIDHSAGYVVFGAGYPDDMDDPYDGSGALLIIQFKIIAAPPYGTVMSPENKTLSCDLDLRDTELGGLGPGPDYDTWTIDHGVTDGYYEYIRPQQVVGTPTAIFTWLPVVVYVGDTVTCDGSSSLSGDDTIVSWDWSLTGNGTWLTANNASTRQFECTGTGIVSVTLNITNTVPLSDDVTHDIEQKVLAGAFFDLYTSENRFCGQTTTFIGEGPDQPCDALSPDVNVTLLVKALWNGKPVMHVLVAFVVLDNLGECVLYRTAETDKDGIARVWFRVATPCTYSNFGKWIAYANGKIQEVKYEDTMPFDVGYAVTLIDESLVTTDEYFDEKTTFLAPCEYIGVGFYAKNIMMIPKEVTFIFVVYDDCDVPLGQTKMNVTIDPGEFCSPNFEWYELEAIHLPQWTYVGTGKVYVSAFTMLPQECGVAYCPEISTEFSLEWSGA